MIYVKPENRAYNHFLKCLTEEIKKELQILHSLGSLLFFIPPRKTVSLGGFSKPTEL